MERPIISFAYDCDEYERERGVAMNIREEMAGGTSETEDEVIDRILTMDYKKRTLVFKSKYLTYGGEATEKCLEKVFGKKGGIQ